MTAWIFRGNREDFDIDNYVTNFRYIYWAVKYKKHRDEISIGDPVFIWRSKGKSPGPYGIIAFGKVVELPEHKSKVLFPKNLLEEYWKKTEVSEYKVGIKLEQVRLDLESGLVEASKLEKDPLLNEMQLIKVRQGTNFKLTHEQFNKICELWYEYFNLDNNDFDDEYEGDETHIKIRQHKNRERDPILVRKAKERFLKKYNKLFCESCGFDFNKIYGFDYVEVHHKKPISSMKPGEKTSLDDLAILCANCHRAVHRIKKSNPWKTLLSINKTQTKKKA